MIRRDLADAYTMMTSSLYGAALGTPLSLISGQYR